MNPIKKKYLIPACACLACILGILYHYFFAALSTQPKTAYLYIDADDTVDSVFEKLRPTAKKHALMGLSTLVRHSDYAHEIQTGRYAIEPGNGAFAIFRRLKNGRQTPVRLTIPSVRTKDRLAAELSKRLMLDSLELLRTLDDETACQKLGYDTASIVCLFIPNTYEVYWDTSISDLMARMKKESKAFWNKERLAAAEQLGLTPNQVITLASIVGEETANSKEKPMIAGMYYNRLMLRNEQYPAGMPLQADPTIKFAWKKFELRRIYNNLLNIDSPYNTYRRTGLPPGPIRIPAIEDIEAVLHLTHHNYLYMCAKEDFSGTHRFAETYAEHLENAARYVQALNRQGIH